MLGIIVGLVGGAVALAVVGLYQWFYGRRFRVLERLTRYGNLVPRSPGEGEGKPAHRDKGKIWSRAGQRLLRPLNGYLTYVERELAKTTILLRPEEFALGALGTAVGLMVVTFLLMGLNLVLMVTLAALGFYFWHFGLARAKTKRLQLFDQQVVEVLDLIGNGLRSGYSFLQAAEMVARETDPPMGTEFKRLLRETGLGVDVETALLDMGRRVDSEDMDMVVTAILIQRQVGGDLAEVLGKISHTIRERIRLQKELRTLTAQGRLSALIIMLLPPGVAFLIFMMSPSFITVLFLDPLGRMLLLMAAVMQLLGIMVIRRIVNLEV